MRSANLALKFLLEVVALVGLVAAGVAIGSGAWRFVLAIGLPLAMVVVWGRWNAPRAAHRLPTAPRIACELAVFAVAAVLLAVAGLWVWAVVFALLVVLNAVLLTAFRQWDA